MNNNPVKREDKIKLLNAINKGIVDIASLNPCLAIIEVWNKNECGMYERSDTGLELSDGPIARDKPGDLLTEQQYNERKTKNPRVLYVDIIPPIKEED